MFKENAYTVFCGTEKTREVGTAMLTLENLSFEVNDDKGEKGIIKDISLTVGDGKFVVPLL